MKTKFTTKSPYSTKFNKNLENLMTSTGFDQETSLELINDFYDYATEQVNNIEKKIVNNSIDEAKGIFHQLKGSSGNLRLKEIYELAEKGEETLMGVDGLEIGKIIESMKFILEEIQGLLEKRKAYNVS